MEEKTLEWEKIKNTDKKYVKIECLDCGNKQIVFTRASTEVTCNICGSKLSKSTGGGALFRGKILEEVE